MTPTDFLGHEEVKSAIKRLSQTPFPLFSSNIDVENHVKNVLGILSRELNQLIRIPQILKLCDFGFKIFRVRDLDGIKNSRSISEYSYPQPSIATEIRRCNFPGYPVFYCSDHPKIALSEIASGQNFSKKKYHISRWGIKSETEEFVVEWLGFGNLSKNTIHHDFKEMTFARIPSIIEGLSESQYDGIKRYLEFVSDVFIFNDNYSISASLAHRSLYDKKSLGGFPTDIFIYPSVQSKYFGVNMAIQPNFVDNSMMPISFYETEIDQLDRLSGKININITRYGEVTDGQIVWRDYNPEDKNYKHKFEEDFGIDFDPKL